MHPVHADDSPLLKEKVSTKGKSYSFSETHIVHTKQLTYTLNIYIYSTSFCGKCSFRATPLPVPAAMIRSKLPLGWPCRAVLRLSLKLLYECSPPSHTLKQTAVGLTSLHQTADSSSHLAGRH